MRCWARLQGPIGAGTGVIFIVFLMFVGASTKPIDKTYAQERHQPNAQQTESQVPAQLTPVGAGGHPELQQQNKEKCEFGGPNWFKNFYCFFAVHEKFWLAFGTLILAGATVTLGLATGFLWAATRKLVRGADRTAESQLQASISITPKLVFNWRQQGNPLGVSFDIENHGQTVGNEIAYDFEMAVLDRPQPDDFNWPVPTRQFDQNNSLFPRQTVPVRLFFDRPLTGAEAGDVEANTKRFHTWGTMHYRDVFGKKRTTRFSFSFGGKNFADAMRGVKGAEWQWEHGQHHNDAT